MELVSAGGRVTLTDIAPLLNLDLHHVETAARALCVKKGKKVVELAGQLIADYYLDTIAEEINESLQESGSCGLVELAQRFALPADFMRQAIETRLGPGGVQGYIEDGQLYTASFIQLHAARTRGIMRALMRPTNLRTLIQRHGLMESRLSKEITALIKEGAIKGTLKGAEDRAIYTPDLFLRGQHAGVDSFFSTNGYIDYKKVERLSVPNPKAFLAAKYPTAMQLSSMALSENMVQSVHMAAEDANNAHLFLHAQSILPNVLSKAEVQQVLEAAVASTNKAAGASKSQLQVLAEVWAVSSLFTAEAKAYLAQQLERWLDEEEVRLDAAAAAVAAAAASSTPAAAASASSSGAKKSSKSALPDSDDDEPAVPAKKGSTAAAAKDKKKGGKKGSVSSDDEDEPAPKAIAAKKGGAKGKRGKRGDSDDEDDAPAAEPVKAKGKIKLPAAGASVPAPLTRDRVSKWLKAGWSSIVKGAQSGNAEIQAVDNDDSTDELQQALATLIHPSLLPLHKARCTARAAALAAAAGASSSSASVSSGSGLGPGSEAVLRRQQLECFRANVQDQYEQILLYQHAIDYLGGKSSEAAAAPPGSIALLGDKQLLSQLESHLNKTLCAALLDVILRMEAFSSLTVVQQNHLQGMDNIITIAATPAAAPAAASDDKDKSTPSPLTRFDLNRTPLTSANRDAVLAALPKRSSEALKPLCEVVGKAAGDPAVFLERLENAARGLDLNLKKLDKKSERSRVFALRKSLMASLGEESKPAVALHLTILLLFAKVHGTVPHAPAKCIPTIRRPEDQSAHTRLSRRQLSRLVALRCCSLSLPHSLCPTVLDSFVHPFCPLPTPSFDDTISSSRDHCEQTNRPPHPLQLHRLHRPLPLWDPIARMSPLTPICRWTSKSST